jgi:glutathione S-transferase
MKLYYSPGACSLSPHIALHEAGIAVETVLASTKSHKLQDGTDYYGINPLGYVPMLELDDGTRLREGPAILQYIADLAPTKNLAPANGTFSATACRSGSPSSAPRCTRASARCSTRTCPRKPRPSSRTSSSLALQVARQRTGRQGLPDGRALQRGRWLPVHRHQLDQAHGRGHLRLPNLQAWHARVGARPAVQEALKAEGLLK